MTGLSNRKSLEPWMPDSIVYYDFQTESIRKFARWQSFINADDMGLGKTLQTLTVFAIDVVLGKCSTMIVVCPTTLKENWANEIRKFTTFNYVVLDGTPAKREEQLRIYEAMSEPKILITNYEQLDRHLDDYLRLGFDIRVADEAHKLKNPKAKRTKLWHKLRTKRTVILTGTPIMNRVDEAWSLLHSVAPHAFPRYWAFVNRYCNTPEAPVWMADGSFKPIGEIVVGDVVMGWRRSESRSRRIKVASTVLEVRRRIAPEVIEVTMESGNVIRTTPDHFWLRVKGGATLGGLSENGDHFVQIGSPSESRIGRKTQRLSLVITPPRKLSTEEQRKADWLCGVYDGEGCRDFIAQSKSHNPEIHAKIGEYLTDLGVEYRVDDTGYQLKGGIQMFSNLYSWWGENLTKRDYFIKRLTRGNRYGDNREGQLNRTTDRIVSVRSIGPGEVVSMQTSSGNYVAWGYASKNCVFGGYQDKQIIGVKNEGELREKLHSIMVRRLKTDVLSLGEPFLVERRVTLHPAQRKIYDRIVDEMSVEMGGEDLDVDNPLTKYLRLKQVCGTTFPFNGEDISSKMDMCFEEDVNLTAAGEKVIVFTQFRDVLECYSKRLEAYGIPVWVLHGDVKMASRQGIVDRWAASKDAGVIVCMLQVAGVGLNMVASSNVAFLDKLYVPGLNRQAIDRANRIGQTKPVIIRDYLARGTVENRVNQILGLKEGLEKDLLSVPDKTWMEKIAEITAESGYGYEEEE